MKMSSARGQRVVVPYPLISFTKLFIVYIYVVCNQLYPFCTVRNILYLEWWLEWLFMHVMNEYMQALNEIVYEYVQGEWRAPLCARDNARYYHDMCGPITSFLSFLFLLSLFAAAASVWALTGNVLKLRQQSCYMIKVWRFLRGFSLKNRVRKKRSPWVFAMAHDLSELLM